MNNEQLDSVKQHSGAKTLLLRSLIAPLFVVGGLWIHERVQVQSEPWLIVDNVLERAIPFLPWTIWIYFSFFPFIVSTVIRVENHLFLRFIRSCILASIIGWCSVLLIPVSFDRPDPASIDSELYRANVIKLHRFSGKISYLVYPDFDRDPHPQLLRSLKVSLRSRDFHWYDYSLSENPPILHRKETMLSQDHPLHAKFTRLTQQEERHGLLSDSSTIGTRDGWNARLAEFGFTHRGHRLIRSRQHE